MIGVISNWVLVCWYSCLWRETLERFSKVQPNDLVTQILLKLWSHLPNLLLKAGRFDGLANSYAAIVLADNATFLLAVNRMVAFCTQASNQPHHQPPSSATVAQPVEQFPHNLEIVGTSPTWDRIFTHACAHLDMCGRRRTILSRFWLRGQLKYHTALTELLTVPLRHSTS